MPPHRCRQRSTASTSSLSLLVRTSMRASSSASGVSASHVLKTVDAGFASRVAGIHCKHDQIAQQRLL